MKYWFFILTLLTLVNCAGPSIDDYEQSGPPLSLETFFQGKLVAYGMVRDRSGKVIRHFNATIIASWQDGVGTLDERFLFNDGEIQKRLWTLKPVNKGHYQGTAPDVVGTANLHIKGQALNIDYQLLVPWNDGTVQVTMDDWLYLVSPNVLINETEMSKWGFDLGKVTLVIMKKEVSTEISELLLPIQPTTTAGE